MPDNQNPLDLFAAQETAIDPQNPLLVIRDEAVSGERDISAVMHRIAMDHLQDLIRGQVDQYPYRVEEDAKFLTIHFQLDAHGNFSVEKEMPNGQLDISGKPAMIKAHTGLKISTNKREHVVSGNLILDNGQTQKIPKIKISKLNDMEKIGPEGIPTGAVSYPVLIAVLEGLLKAKVTVEIDAKAASRMFDEEKGKIASNLLKGISEYLKFYIIGDEHEKIRVISILAEKSKQYGFQAALIPVLAQLGVAVKNGEIAAAESVLKSKTRKIQE